MLPDKTASELYTMVGLQKLARRSSIAISCTTWPTPAIAS